MVVETETDRDWAKDVKTETLSRVSLISAIVSYDSEKQLPKIEIDIVDDCPPPPPPQRSASLLLKSRSRHLLPSLNRSRSRQP